MYNGVLCQDQEALLEYKMAAGFDDSPPCCYNEEYWGGPAIDNGAYVFADAPVFNQAMTSPSGLTPFPNVSMTMQYLHVCAKLE